jgi:hypothetical protein
VRCTAEDGDEDGDEDGGWVRRLYFGWVALVSVKSGCVGLHAGSGALLELHCHLTEHQVKGFAYSSAIKASGTFAILCFLVDHRNRGTDFHLFPAQVRFNDL